MREGGDTQKRMNERKKRAKARLIKKKYKIRN